MSLTFIWKNLKFKMVAMAIFKRVLDIIRLKIGHLKGENKWKAVEVSIQMNWTLKGSKERIS